MLAKTESCLQVTALVQGKFAVDKDVVECAFFVKTKWTVSRCGETPELQHVRCFYRVDLSIKNESDDSWPRTIDEVLPREIKGSGILPVSPNALLDKARGVTEELFFLQLTKNRSCFCTDFRECRVCKVRLSAQTKTGTVCLTSKPKAVFNNRGKEG